MIKVVVLGAGNVGTHLCQVFEKNNQILLLQNYNRKGVSIQNCNVTVTNKIKEICSADVYLVAFNDNALPEIYSELKQLKGLVVHTSGATPISCFGQFKNFGVFYPLQSFNKELPVDFLRIPIAIEANNKENENLLLRLARSISNNTHVLSSEQRKALHVAAVFANNFSNFMYTQSKSICDDFGIDFQILKPLINETIQKLAITSPEKMQTGPAIRYDTKTIEFHLDTLKKKEQKKMYTTLTKAIQEYYEKEL